MNTDIDDMQIIRKIRCDARDLLISMGLDVDVGQYGIGNTFEWSKTSEGADYWMGVWEDIQQYRSSIYPVKTKNDLVVKSDWKRLISR